MEFKVLGPLEVTDGSRVVEISAPKQRAVLAALLLQANHVVSLDSLIDQLWGEHPPPQASGALQAYISNLRRALEPDRPPRAPSTVLVSRPPGYVLVVDPARYDAARFDTAVSTAQRLLAEGDPGAARRTLDAAMALWRGPALAEFAFEDFARPEAARLEDLRAVALELLAEADLALGRHAGAVIELERLAAEHPLRERLWSLLMVALYRSGRQGDALRAYQQCRAALGEELGIEPSPDLRRLEEAILAQSTELDWRPPTTASRRPPAGPVPAAPAPAAPAPVPAPPSDRPNFVGRSEQLDRLDRAWARALTGRSGIVLVAGEPGIGKTRLVEELAHRAAASGAAVGWGRSYEGEGAPPFWPWAQVMRMLTAGDRENDVRAAVAAAGAPPSQLAPLVPEWGSGEPPMAGPDPGEARFRLNQAVTELLAVLSRERPLLLALDDLQWADAPSLQLLQHLATQLQDARVLVVGTYRDLEVHASHPLADALAVVARQPSLERIRLHGLTPSELARFLAEATGAEPAPALVATVHARTEGNPFFVTELVRLLQSEGSLHDAGAAERSHVPAGVRDVVRRRLVRLPEQTNALLSVAAVAGQEFDVSVIEAVAGLDEEAVLEAVELALVSGLVVEGADDPTRFRFSHALVRETLYEGLSGLRRARLHARVGEALEGLHTADLDPVAAEIAGHLLRAGHAVPAARTVPFLLRAAERAQRQLAYERAEQDLRRALDLLATMPAGEERDRHERWAQARLGVLLGWTKGQAAPEVTHAFARARELCDRAPDAVAELPILYGLYLGALFGTDLDSATGFARQLLDAAERHQDPRYLLAGHLAFGMVLFQRGELAASREHCQRAAVLADSLAEPWLADVISGEPRSMSRCYWSLGLALAGERHEADALSALAVEQAREADHPFSVSAALAIRAWATLMCGDAAATRDAAEAALDYATRRGFELLTGASTVLRAWALSRLGDRHAAVPMVREGLDAVEAVGLQLMKHFQLAVKAEVEQEAGLLPEALATVERGLAEVEATSECFYESELHRLRAELVVALWPDRFGEAEQELRRAVEVARDQGARALEARAQGSLDRLLDRLSTGVG